jgi:hypothetical protein
MKIETTDIMNVKLAYVFFLLLTAVSLGAQQSAADTYLEKINKTLPHKFKQLHTGATLEAVREQRVVKIYMLIDDIEQYDQILVERGDQLQNNFGQCKVVQIEKGKYKNNYLEVVDNYPLPPKMSNIYRIKTVTSEGIMRMYPPVAVEMQAEVGASR